MVPVARQQRQGCSDFARSHDQRSVLLVGAERGDEFADALRLVHRGYDVTAVNPRVTPAARRFVATGGTVLQARLEELPRECGRYEMICENYPYPSGHHYVPPRPFALARLLRLAPGGRWILHTEAVRFATLIKAAIDHERTLRDHFVVTLSNVDPDTAPLSHYPAVKDRFRLVVERCG